MPISHPRIPTATYWLEATGRAVIDRHLLTGANAVVVEA